VLSNHFHQPGALARLYFYKFSKVFSVNYMSFGFVRFYEVFRKPGLFAIPFEFKSNDLPIMLFYKINFLFCFISFRMFRLKLLSLKTTYPFSNVRKS